MSEERKVSVRDVKKLAKECKDVARTLNFDQPVINEDFSISTAKPTPEKVRPSNEISRNKRLLEYSVPSDEERDNIHELADEEKILKQIQADLEAEKNKVQEVEALEEGVIDTIKKYVRRGLLTATIIAQLLSAGSVTAQQLTQAGVPEQDVKQAVEKVEKEQKGGPEFFSYARVNAIAINDTINKDDVNFMGKWGHGQYSSSDRYKLVTVDYKLDTDKPYTTTHTWASTLDWDNFNNTPAEGKTDLKNLIYVGSEDESPATYTVSDYPQQIKTKDGETLDFLGVQVIRGNPTRKNSFLGKRGVEFAKIRNAGSNFIEAKDKKSVSFKANTATINLVYGQEYGEKPVPPHFKQEFHNLFDYNSTDVKTQSQDYQNLLEKTVDFIKDNPDSKFEIRAYGSASQVPTNYPDMEGEKTTEANAQLAKDRALALGKQVLKDLKEKGVDIGDKIVSKKVTSPKGTDKAEDYIGDVEYKEDPGNTQRYASDQFAGIELKSVKK